MTNRISRIRGAAAQTNLPSAPDRSAPDLQISPGPGTQSVRTVLGEDGYRRLADQCRLRGTALGALASLVQDTAREADRLHGKLRRHATQVRDRLGDVLNPRWDAAFVPVTGLLASTGHTSDLHASRFAQQMNQLTLVLESYQAAMRHPGNVTNRS
ncbi:hypothetical protein ACWD4N_15720 [Streptomyces sp. NPDC002586]|uniref:hypothetical protein n=1 Tax=Streptomyces sp. NPDC002589 TaxID=3154420 RepID=UPI003330CA4B